MSYATTSSRYREMEVLAMTPAQRLVMLYGRLLVLLKQARLDIVNGDIVKREEHLGRAEEIVHELAVSLNHETGGALAASLASVYAWLVGEFAGIHSRPETARLDAVIVIVADLHQAWQGAAAQLAAAEPA